MENLLGLADSVVIFFLSFSIKSLLAEPALHHCIISPALSPNLVQQIPGKMSPRTTITEKNDSIIR